MAVNDVTGDRLVSAVPTEDYKSGWEAIWGNKQAEPAKELTEREMEHWLEMMGYNSTSMFADEEDYD